MAVETLSAPQRLAVFIHTASERQHPEGLGSHGARSLCFKDDAAESQRGSGTCSKLRSNYLSGQRGPRPETSASSTVPPSLSPLEPGPSRRVCVPELGPLWPGRAPPSLVNPRLPLGRADADDGVLFCQPGFCTLCLVFHLKQVYSQEDNDIPEMVPLIQKQQQQMKGFRCAGHGRLKRTGQGPWDRS